MEKFLDWLCGSSDYTIIRCQKVTKDELRERIKASFAEDRASIEQLLKPDSASEPVIPIPVTGKMVFRFGTPTPRRLT